eukprot:UN30263
MENRLVEYFLVVGFEKKLRIKLNANIRNSGHIIAPPIKNPEVASDPLNPFSHVRFENQIVDRYPRKDYPDSPLAAAHLEQFCLPTGLYITHRQEMPMFYTFVWTEATGKQLYGSCLRFYEQVDTKILDEFVQSDEALDYGIELN